jgi:hypothetical protein
VATDELAVLLGESDDFVGVGKVEATTARYSKSVFHIHISRQSM